MRHSDEFDFGNVVAEDFFGPEEGGIVGFVERAKLKAFISIAIFIYIIFIVYEGVITMLRIIKERITLLLWVNK